MRQWLFRYRWSLGLVGLAGLSWIAAFLYLTQFRLPDVPFVTTPLDVVTAMLDLAEVTDADTVYDLGSGDGRIVVAAARRGARSVGIEIDADLVSQSLRAAQEAGVTERVQFRRGDLFEQDLRPATVVTMYLLPHLNSRLRPQLEQLRPGTRVVSHSFRIEGTQPTRTLSVRSSETGQLHTLYLWITPIRWE